MTGVRSFFSDTTSDGQSVRTEQVLSRGKPGFDVFSITGSVHASLIVVRDGSLAHRQLRTADPAILERKGGLL